MNKLRNKVFFTVIIILTLSLSSFLVAFNWQHYSEEKKVINNSLDMLVETPQKSNMNNMGDHKQIWQEGTFEEEDLAGERLDKNWKFMDSAIYTVLLGQDNSILEIINRTPGSNLNSHILSIATTILSQDNIAPKHIGNLYFEDYCYSYTAGTELEIFDNTSVKHKLRSYLIFSFVVFVISECVIFLIASLITRWIIKPVKESFDKQRQFIADASHELKTPLSVIIASGEAFEDHPEEHKWLENIKYESDRMNLLITDLLELANSEGNIQKLYEIADLSKVIELSALAFEGKTFEKNLSLNLDIEENIRMKIDKGGIKQVVGILLDNAISHSKEQGQIEVILKRNNGDVIFEVTNEGDPIPAGEEERIFERFYRVDKARNRAENRYGLGLAIAKNIVENHKGKISASSSGGKTVFRVVFRKVL
jgi:two-component sensor histidine kinase